MCEELGDVLMQVAFHAQIEAERGRFTMANVVDGVARKLVYRHPHVFGDVQADTSQQVLANWDVLKRREKGQRSTADAVEAVPHTLPALWRAEKIQSKTAKAGFDWTSSLQALDKLEEEVRELRAALEAGQAADAPHGIREELGDTLFMAAKSPRCRAWTRRTPSTGPATSLTAASARWKRPRTSLCRSAVRRSCWPSGTMQNPTIRLNRGRACLR